MSQDFLDTYLEYLEGKDFAHNTILAYHSDAENFVRWYEKHYGKSIIDRPIEKSAANTYYQMARKNGDAHNTIHRKFSSLVSLLFWLEETGMIEHGIPTPILPGSIPFEPLNSKQIDAVVKAIDEDIENANHLYIRSRWRRYRDAMIVRLILIHNVNPESVPNIKLDDCLEKDGEVKFIRVKDEEDNTHQIQLNKRSSEILQDYLYIRPLNTESYLFINQQGEQLAMRTVRRAVKKYEDVLEDFNRRLTPTLLFKSSREK